jgi:hypothetical protein
MKTLILLLLISIMMFSGCGSKNQPMDFDSGVWIFIPQNFKVEENPSSSGTSVLKGVFMNESIFCLAAPVVGMDTMESLQIASILEINARRYIEPFNGTDFSIGSRMINDSEAKKFRFEYVRSNSLYEAVKPIERSTKVRIEGFFDSIQLN